MRKGRFPVQAQTSKANGHHRHANNNNDPPATASSNRVNGHDAPPNARQLIDGTCVCVLRYSIRLPVTLVKSEKRMHTCTRARFNVTRRRRRSNAMCSLRTTLPFFRHHTDVAAPTGGEAKTEIPWADDAPMPPAAAAAHPSDSSCTGASRDVGVKRARIDASKLLDDTIDSVLLPSALHRSIVVTKGKLALGECVCVCVCCTGSATANHPLDDAHIRHINPFRFIGSLYQYILH